jgi:hypothetical protein
LKTINGNYQEDDEFEMLIRESLDTKDHKIDPTYKKQKSRRANSKYNTNKEFVRVDDLI